MARVTVVGRYLTLDRRQPVVTGSLILVPPVPMPGEQQVENIRPSRRGNGDFSFLAESGGTDRTFVFRENLEGVSRTLSLVVPADAFGELRIADLSGWSSPSHVVLTNVASLDLPDREELRSARIAPSMSMYPEQADHFRKVLYQRGDTLYACAQSGTFTVYRSDNFGRTWTTKGVLPADPRVILRVEKTGTLLAVESTDQGLAGQNPRVWRSVDDGVNWTQVTTLNFPPLSGQGISETPAGHLLVAEYGNVGTTVYRIMRSTDDGANFSAVYSSSGTEPAGDPGHIHSVTWDPYANCFVAFSDRPIVAGVSGPRLLRSNDEGATWTVIGEASQATFPNFVAPMHFPNHIAWGTDNQLNGRLFRIARADFYAGNFAAAELVATVNRKANYYPFPVREGVWVITAATELIAPETEPFGPGSYNAEVYVVSDNGARVTGGVETSVPMAQAGVLGGLKAYVPARHYGTFDHAGKSWLNLPSLTSAYGYTAVPYSVGEQPPMRRLDSYRQTPGTRKFTPGTYVGTQGRGNNVIAQGVGVETAVPFWVPTPVHLDKIACEVTTGATGATVRLGVRDSTLYDGPNLVVLDSGTLAGGVLDAATTGVKEVDIDLWLTPGLYWLTAVVQGAAAALRNIGTGHLPPCAPMSFIGSTATQEVNCWFRTGVSGALTNWAGGSVGSQGYKVLARVA